MAELDAQSGSRKSGGDVGADVPSVAGTNVYGTYGRTAFAVYGDEGGASRFFPSFRYQAKAPASERPKIDGKGWPTVKPQGLMRWLVRLLTPPGGVVLDPFAGTSATLQAARDEGFASIGIERDEFAYLLSCRRLGLPELVPAVVEPDLVADPVLAEIAEATSYDQLIAIYLTHKPEWTDERTQAAAARRTELEVAA